MEEYSMSKRNGISSHGKTQRKLEHLLLSDRNLYEKTAYYMIPTIWHLEKTKL
jgi:hypothetical protein